MKLIIIVPLFFSIAFGMGCGKSASYRLQEDEIPTDCGTAVKIDQAAYKNSPSDKVNIQNASIVGDCLKITFSAGGCNSDTWKPQLFDAGVIADSYPEQRYIRMTLVTGQFCKALFTKTVFFDLKPVRIDGSKKVALNLDGYGQAILYSY